MKKGVSWLICLALLLTQFAPLGYAGSVGGIDPTTESMLANPSDARWLNVSDVQRAIAWLDDNLENLEREEPQRASQYYRIGREALSNIKDYCGKHLKAGDVKVGQESRWGICNDVYNIQRRLGSALSVQYTGTTEYLANAYKGIYEAVPTRVAAQNRAQAGTATTQPTNGVELNHADYYATFSSGTSTPLTYEEEMIAKEISEMLAMGKHVDIARMGEYLARKVELAMQGQVSRRSLRMIFEAYADAFVSTGHSTIEGQDRIWQYIANYKIDETSALLAANAILLQPNLRANLTHGQWKTIIKIFGEELMTHDYPAEVVAQELARLFMLKEGPADANEYIVTAINLENGNVETGLKNAYMNFVWGGQQLVENATGHTIPLTNEELLAQRRAHGVVGVLHDIVEEVCPGVEAIDALIAFAATRQDFPNQAHISPLSHFGAMIIFALDFTGDNATLYPYEEARSVVKDFLAQAENSRIEQAKNAAKRSIQSAFQNAMGEQN